MYSLRTDRFLRLGAGAAVLLLLVAEEKVCPSLVIPPSELAPGGADRPDRSADQHPARKLPSLSLHSVLPETPDPGRTAQATLAACRQAGAWQDGVVILGRFGPAQAVTHPALPADLADWHVLAVPLRSNPPVPPAPVCERVRSPIFGTTICPLGPPRA